MKKSIVTLFLICVTASAWAADLPKQGFGVQIGWAQPILRVNSPSSTPKDSLTSTLALKGFKVGVVYDASLIKGFGTSLGINYTLAGNSTAWQQKNTVSIYPQQRTKTLYQELEVFVDWQYKFEVAGETYLMLYTGPTILCGLAFQSHTDERDMYDNITPNTSVQTRYEQHTGYDSNNDLKRLNVTWGIGAGFQYKRYFLRGGYDFGLLNPYANKQFYNSDGTIKDHYTRGRLDQWSIKIGAYLWYK